MKYRFAMTLAAALGLVLTVPQAGVHASSLGFNPAVVFTVPGATFPNDIAVGDLNHDGYADLVVANVSQPLAILLNNHDGTFTLTNFGIARNAVALADLNGDGNLDLITLGSVTNNPPANNAQIYYGDGTGNFGQPITLPSAGSDPQGVVVADVTGDGRPDIIIVGGNSPQAVVNIQQPDGSFIPLANAVTMPTLAGQVGPAMPWTVAAGDLNGDGKPDLIFGTTSFSGSTSRNDTLVFINGGLGVFTFASSMQSGDMFVQIADMNRDGKMDIVNVDPTRASIDVHLNTGNDSNHNPTFAPSQVGPAFSTDPIGNGIHGLRVADMDGDGKLDVVVGGGSQPGPFGSPTASGFAVFAGDGTGALGAPLKIGNTAGATAIGDFNNDGNPDVARAAQITGQGTTVLISISTLPPSKPAARVAADFSLSTDLTGHAAVTLDGSASTGPNLTYTWTEGATQLSTGTTAIVSVPLSGFGVHHLTLTVSNFAGTSSAALNVTLLIPTVGGPAGADGPKGDTGAAGLPGPKGDTGDPGPKGDKGDAGAQGDKGDSGPKGDPGANGAPGAKGDTGPKGDSGVAGAPGAKGDMGPKGDPGANGAQGAAGFSSPLLFLADGQAPPPGYVLLGTFKGSVQLTGAQGQGKSVTVFVYQRQ